MLQIPEQLVKILQKYWDRYGDCLSCGWHALLREHSWCQIDRERKCLSLDCANSEVENYDHRRVWIYPNDEDWEKVIDIFNAYGDEDDSIIFP